MSNKFEGAAAVFESYGIEPNEVNWTYLSQQSSASDLEAELSAYQGYPEVQADIYAREVVRQQNLVKPAEYHIGVIATASGLVKSA